jgi:Trk K+ transport system NAD-binding subunit
VQGAFGVDISHSVSYVAAPAFAAAMMDHDVLATIPVGRRVLLIAEVAVAAGSEFDGGTVAAAHVPGSSCVIAVYAGPEPRPSWSPPGRHRIRAGNRLVVVATRAGLARIVEASTPATELTPA